VTHFVQAPRVSANEDNVKLVVWVRHAGESVRLGEVIAVFETQKATFDLEAAASGYLAIRSDAGAVVSVGEVVAAITEVKEAMIEWPVAAAAAAKAEAEGRRATKKAELVARRAGVDLGDVAALHRGDGPITEADVANFVKTQKGSKPREAATTISDTVDSAFPARRQQRLLIIGAGNGAVQLLDVIARVPTQRAVGCVDDADRLQGKRVMGVPVVGRCKDVIAAYRDGFFDSCIVSVSKIIALSETMFQELTGAGIPFANVIDPSVLVRSNVVLGDGNVILPYTHIGACAVLGHGNFVGPFADIEHHNTVGSFCTFGPGVMTSGGVTIGDRVRFGTGIFVEPHISIGDDCVVASGAILTADVPEGSAVKTRANYVVRPRAPRA
jgi:sugar O-acyltransferase (sialic acid O-acetyltransferase NeuD family)